MPLDALHKAGETLARIASLSRSGAGPIAAPGRAELARLYFSLDRYDEALALIGAASAAHDADAQELRLIEAKCRFHLGEHARAGALLDALVRSPIGVHDDALRGRAETLRSWIELESGRIESANQSAEAALAHLRPTAEHVGYGEGLLAIGRVRFRQGRLSESREAFRDALAAFRRGESLSGTGRAIHDLALIDKAQGRYPAAEEGYRTALEIAEDLGQRRFVMTRRHNLAILLFHTGQIHASRGLAEASLADALEIGDAFVEACARITCGRAAMALVADPESARAHLERALSIADSRGFRREHALAEEFLGDLAWRGGDRPGAEARWDRALTLIESVSPKGDAAGEVLRRLAGARAAGDDLSSALGLARRAFRVTRACSDRRETAAVLGVFGAVAARRQRPRAAWGAYSAAVRILDGVGAKRELAEVLAAMARDLASLDGGVIAREAEDRAAELFSEIGCPAPERRTAAPRGSAGPGPRGVTTPASGAPIRPARSPHPSRHLFVRGARGRREILTRDPAFAALLDRVGVVSKRPGSVLLLGETGTGKELLARLVHDDSNRRGRFIAANVAAIPDGLVESELFGHVRGAFTGASEEKMGLLEAADGGTFFLDEIGDLPHPTQVKLLRLLDDAVVKRVGAVSERAVDVRFVAATNVDLAKLVREGLFRSDLYYRLSVHEIAIPALAERRGDVALLATHFLGRLAEGDHAQTPLLAPEALAALESYRWPGNVREFQSEMERAYSRAHGGDEIRVTHLSPWIAPADDDDGDPGLLRGEIAALEKNRIREALVRTAGNTSRAADALGMTPQALRYKLRKYGLVFERQRYADPGNSGRRSL